MPGKPSTYQCPSYEIPHEIDLILRRCWRHIRLLQIGRHGGVVCELVEQVAQFLSKICPFLGGGGGKFGSCEACGEFFAGGCVGVHSCY